MDPVTIYLFRFGIGMIVGIKSIIIPTYLISITPPELTGIVGSFNQLFIATGVAVAYRCGYFYILLRLKNWVWNGYMSVPIIPILINLVVIYFMSFDSLERHYRNN